MAVNANELRKGQAIQYNSDICVVLEVTHRTPGNLRAFVQAILRSIRTGKSMDVRFSSAEKVETVPLMTRKMEFSYKSGDDFVFVDPESYEEVTVTPEFVGDAKNYLTENSQVTMTFVEEKAVIIELPSSVVLTVADAPEGLKGDSANNVQKTVTLETGAGHASRAAMSPFAEEFNAARRALEARGMGAEEMREELESLTLGRLRIASKATERQGDDLVSMDAARQRAEGMYMIGQAAQLRSAVTTIDALHQEVGEGGSAYLRALETPAEVLPPRPAAPKPADVAIVGISTFLPGAENVEEYWENLLDGRNAVTEIPRHRWDHRIYFDPDPAAEDKIYSKWGGFLPDMVFDPMKFGMPPRSIKAIDPLQLMTLELTHRCLTDAGYAGEDAMEGPRLRTSVILGASGGAGDVGAQYAVRSEMPRFLGEVDPQAAKMLPDWTEDSFAGILLNVAAGRTANRLDFGGVNYTVDAACASSLTAVYQAVLELESGRSDMVLAGGIDTVQGPFGY